MSFVSDTRDEVARLPVGDICCMRSEFAAALCACGISFIWPNRYELNITSSSAVIVRRYFSMLKQGWGVTAEIRAIESGAFGGMTRYRLMIPEELSETLMRDCGLWDENALFNIRQTPFDAILNFDCCKKAFTRSAFLMSGTIGDPKKAYTWEISAPSEAYAQTVQRCLAAFDIDARISTRRNQKYIVYLRSAERIADALSMIGASHTVLDFENVRLQKALSNELHRTQNCDNVNINRAFDTSERQIKQIMEIDALMGLDKLPATLREMAQVRLANAGFSISELGNQFDPPLTKSAVNARLRRLSAIAEKLTQNEQNRS